MLDEQAEDPAQVFIASLSQRSRKLEAVSVEQMARWEAGLRAFLGKVNDPLTRHLAKLRTSPWSVRLFVYQRPGRSQADQLGLN